MSDTFYEVYENGSKRIATGFQFIEDAQWFIEQYRKNHKDCGILTISKVN